MPWTSFERLMYVKFTSCVCGVDNAFKNALSHINKFSNPYILHKEATAKGDPKKKKLFLKISLYSQGLKAWNFIEKRFQRRCFPVNIAKFLTTLILKNIYERLLLYTEPLMVVEFLCTLQTVYHIETSYRVISNDG